MTTNICCIMTTNVCCHYTSSCIIRNTFSCIKKCLFSLYTFLYNKKNKHCYYISSRQKYLLPLYTLLYNGNDHCHCISSYIMTNTLSCMKEMFVLIIYLLI